MKTNISSWPSSEHSAARRCQQSFVCRDRTRRSAAAVCFFGRLIDTKLRRVMQTTEAEEVFIPVVHTLATTSRLIFLKVAQKRRHLRDICRVDSVLTNCTQSHAEWMHTAPPHPVPAAPSLLLPVFKLASEGYFAAGGRGLGGASICLLHGVNFSRLG